MESNDKEFYLALIVVIIAIFVGSTIGYLAFLEGLPLWLSGVLGFFCWFSICILWYVCNRWIIKRGERNG